MCSNLWVRWDGQALTAVDPDALPGLGQMAGLVRSVQTPEFAGITFHEVRCRSALNRVPRRRRVPFGWTINPYRGCSHGCVYCFARNTHTTSSSMPVTTSTPRSWSRSTSRTCSRRELARPRWRHEHVAMGTNTDPYQRAEGRYRLMPGIISALADSGTPFSILTKGTMLSRDLGLLAAGRDPGAGRCLDLAGAAVRRPAPGARAGNAEPRARLALIRRIRGAGLPCGVLWPRSCRT